VKGSAALRTDTLYSKITCTLKMAPVLGASHQPGWKKIDRGFV
jgi:hypothetical protein